MRTIGATALLAVALTGGDPSGTARVEVLESIAGLPPHIVGRFRESVSFERTETDHYLVFDRAGHTVYQVPPSSNDATQLVRIGAESWHILGASAFDLSGDRFLVADGPNGRERVRRFDLEGRRLAGFRLPGRAGSR